jgi:hypothetical protein
MHLLVFNHIGQGQIGLALACVSLKGSASGEIRNDPAEGGGFFYGNSVCQYLLNCMQRGNINFQENSFVPENQYITQ